MLENFNLAVATGTFLLQILGIVILFSLYKENNLTQILRRYSGWLIFSISAISIFGSLYYSDIAGFVPCALCWYQRIAIYPQALIMALAIWKKDSSWPKYIIALSAIGAVIALYNHYLQLGGNPLVPCGVENSCAKRYIFEFGYMTMPLMAFTAFAANGLLAILANKKPAA